MSRDRVLSAAAALLCLLVFMPIVQVGVNVFDEGFISAGAMLIRRGWLPMRDFFVIYGPGQYYVSAALFSVFGEDLFVQRVAHVLLLSLIGLGLLSLARRLGATRGAQVWLLVAYVAVNALFMPTPGYAAVLACGLLLWAGVVLVEGLSGERQSRLVQASVLIGVAGLVRWDFGIFGLVTAATAALAHGRLRLRWRALAALFGPALLVWLLLFVPFVMAGGWERWWAEVPVFHSREFAEWRGRPVLRPTVWALARAWAQGDMGSVSETVTLLLAVCLPLVLALPTMVVAGMRLWRRASTAPVDLLAWVLALLTLTLLNQVRVRSGLPQGLPAFYAALPLAPYLWRACTSPAGRRAVAALAALVLVMPAVSAVQVWCQAVWNTEPVALPRASHVRVDGRDREAWKTYGAMLRHLSTCLPPQARLFSGVQDTSRLYVNDAALYFLTDRLPATRWVEMEPGLTNSSRAQAALARDLLEPTVGAAVLWQRVSNEPNATSRSNGVHTVDETVAVRFAPGRRFGAYEVRFRADTGPPDTTRCDSGK